MSPRNNIEIGAGKESRVKTAVWIVAGALGTAAFAAPAPAVTPAPPPRAEFLDRLHDGRFNAAVAANTVEPGSPESSFLAAFVTWWRLIFDDDNLSLQTLLDHQLEAAVEAAGDGDTPDAVLWAGNGHLLLAQLRAWQRRPLAAAFEAKKAKKTLEAAVRSGSDVADASFGLGTYNYMADTLPSYVKGLRALLFLPAGDRDKGLDQIAQAARESGIFAFEARVLLITIYANRHEKMYTRALEERDHLVEQAPDRIATLYASARLDISLGRNDAAIAALDRATARAALLRDVDPVVLRSIDLLRARAQFSDLRFDLCAATARAALASTEGVSPSLRHDFEEILAASDKLSQGVDWSVLSTALATSSPARVTELATARPERPMLALLAGDVSLRSGKAEDAITWLTRASTGTLPLGVRGACQLRLGQASDLLGQRARALDFYKQAADTPGFASKDAAVFYQQAPYRSGA